SVGSRHEFSEEPPRVVTSSIDRRDRRPGARVAEDEQREPIRRAAEAILVELDVDAGRAIRDRLRESPAGAVPVVKAAATAFEHRREEQSQTVRAVALDPWRDHARDERGVVASGHGDFLDVAFEPLDAPDLEASTLDRLA